MSKKKNDVDEIKLRKQRLQNEIDSIEEKYSKKATKISNGIQNTLKPVQTIRDNPLKSLGVSIAIGVVLGMSGRRKKRSGTSPAEYSDNPDTGSSGFTSLLVSELKRMAAKRAMIYISDIIDRRVMPEIRDIRTRETERAPKRKDV